MQTLFLLTHCLMNSIDLHTTVFTILINSIMLMWFNNKSCFLNLLAEHVGASDWWSPFSTNPCSQPLLLMLSLLFQLLSNIIHMNSSWFPLLFAPSTIPCKMMFFRVPVSLTNSHTISISWSSWCWATI